MFLGERVLCNARHQNAEDQVAPAFGGEFGRRRRGDPGTAKDPFWRQAALSHAAAFRLATVSTSFQLVATN
jgi:hypothetical protein